MTEFKTRKKDKRVFPTGGSGKTYKKEYDEKEGLVLQFKESEKYARQLGFDKVYYDKSGTFVAEDSVTSVVVRRDEKYGGLVFTEISWSSAGTPRPSDEKVEKTIKMLQNALKLKRKLEEIE